MICCATCYFFRRAHGRPVMGLCRKFPPQVALAVNGCTRTVWPEVSETDWCGEHATVDDAVGGDR